MRAALHHLSWPLSLGRVARLRLDQLTKAEASKLISELFAM